MKSLPASLLLSVLLLNLSCQTSSRMAEANDAEAASSRKPASACDPKDFGAKADGRTDDTKSIQAAIDRCAGSGGGTVTLSGGTFISGTIRLKSAIEFTIQTGATLKGTQNDSQYPDLEPPSRNTQLGDAKKALVYAESGDNITIDGGGTIDGSGANPNWIGKERTRPMAIFIAVSKNILIQNLNVKDAGMWGVVALESDNIVIRNLNEHSAYFPNRDGVDIVDCHHVLIENSSIYSGDDAVCLKSGSSRGVSDVTVRNVKILNTGANGLKLGSSSVGPFKNILFENIELTSVDKAAMALESIDGSAIDSVRFHHIRFNRAGSTMMVILGRRLLSFSIGSISNIEFDDIVGTTSHTWGSLIAGTEIFFHPYKVTNVTLNNVHVTNANAASSVPGEPYEYLGQYPEINMWGDLPAFGYYLRHIDGLKMTSSTVEAAPLEPRPLLTESDVQNFQTGP